MKTLLVWGGTTSIGCNAIQLAIAAGYEVITTASLKDFDFVKKLGASQVFDYESKTIVDDLVHAFKAKTTAGTLSIGHGAAAACMDVLDKRKGDKFIAMFRARHIRTMFIFASTLIDNRVGEAVYMDLLPKAVVEGTYVAAPNPLVVRKGLEYIQARFDLQKKGTSAKKVVVSL